MAHKILMVEDDFALAMGTEYALTSEGYAVTTAGNLAQAREKFDDSIDTRLAGMNTLASSTTTLKPPSRT